jgi:hypothetical protein
MTFTLNRWDPVDMKSTGLLIGRTGLVDIGWL